MIVDSAGSRGLTAKTPDSPLFSGRCGPDVAQILSRFRRSGQLFAPRRTFAASYFGAPERPTVPSHAQLRPGLREGSPTTGSGESRASVHSRRRSRQSPDRHRRQACGGQRSVFRFGFVVGILAVVDESQWPPGPDEYVPRRVVDRLEGLKDLTDLRSSGWDGETASVGVWPFSDEIVAAVRQLLAPLKVEVSAAPTRPRRMSSHD
jgi:hypothetical protein